MKLLKSLTMLIIGFLLTYGAAQAGTYLITGDIQEIGGNEMLGATTLKVPNGGTGANSFTAGECLVGNGTGAITTAVCGAGGGGGGGVFSTTTILTYYNGNPMVIGGTATTTDISNSLEIIGGLYVDEATTTGFTINGERFTDLAGAGLTNAAGVLTLNISYDVLGQATSTLLSHTTTYNHANYDTAYGWGNHASAGYFPLSTWYATTTHALISSLPSLSITESQISDLGSYLPLTGGVITGSTTVDADLTVTGEVYLNKDQGTVYFDGYSVDFQNATLINSTGNNGGQVYVNDNFYVNGNTNLTSGTVNLGTIGNTINMNSNDISAIGWATSTNGYVASNGTFYYGANTSGTNIPLMRVNSVNDVHYLPDVSGGVNNVYIGYNSPLPFTFGGSCCGGTAPSSFTFTTDGTGSGEIVMPDDAIGAGELDSTTGAYDFGGVTSLEIPNGASPTVDSIGEIAVDSSSDQLVYYGGAKRVLLYEFDKSFTIGSSTIDGDYDSFDVGSASFTLWSPHKAVTLTDLYCKTDTGTLDCKCGDGTNWTETVTCDDDGQEDDGSISNGTFAAREDVICVCDNQSSDPNEVWLTTTWVYTAD